METLSRTVPARFWRKVTRGPGCWLWRAATSRTGRSAPRAYFYLDGRVTPAARALWAMLNGPVPAGLEVCHSCDDGLCVNPAHLFLGTRSDNMRDAQRKGRLVSNLPAVARYYPRRTK